MEFADLRGCLEEISRGFPALSVFWFVVDIDDEPSCIKSCVDFGIRLALDQHRASSSIKGHMYTKSGPCFSDEGEEEDEVDGDLASMKIRRTDSLKQAWDQAYTSIPGRVREVSLSILRYN